MKRRMPNLTPEQVHKNRVRARREGPAEDRALRFFTENPHEELTLQDLATKFGCSEWTARQILTKLHGAGLIERAIVYRGIPKVLA